MKYKFKKYCLFILYDIRTLSTFAFELFRLLDYKTSTCFKFVIFVMLNKCWNLKLLISLIIFVYNNIRKMFTDDNSDGNCKVASGTYQHLYSHEIKRITLLSS